MALHHFPPTVNPQEVAEHLADRGYAIVDRVVGPQLLDRLASELEPFVRNSDVGQDQYDGAFTKRTGALIARSPTSRELVMHPLAIATVERFLRHATAVQLLLTQLITIEPGETRQKLHRDQMMFDLYPFPPHYHVQCNTMWAITDFTSENGATHICPGSSGLTDAAAAEIDPIQAEMERGSVLFYEGKVLHGGGANTGTRPRQGVNITYGVGWVRQEENQFLACPTEIARTLDDDLLRMMGYQQGAFSLGYVGDQLDPLAVLRGSNTKAGRIDAYAPHNEVLDAFADEAADHQSN
ncbi:MAG: phytanoyl-CoA dioxygenase family protein [Acidimicrobiales bacterium]|nr:phytanoyl-CoA dioxygenase family protein [Acidimicrobiales bacterium]